MSVDCISIYDGYFLVFIVLLSVFLGVGMGFTLGRAGRAPRNVAPIK
jgi:hypothetical protein